MDINSLINSLLAVGIVNLFFKTAAVLLSFMYLLYAIVLAKQTQVMNTALTVGRSSLIQLISTLQIFAALLLILLGIFFV